MPLRSILGPGKVWMKALFEGIRHNPILWLMDFIPAVFGAHRLRPEADTRLFVLAIVPLAALLSHATESVAAKTCSIAP